MRPLIPLALLVLAAGLGLFLYGGLNEDDAANELSITGDSERTDTVDPEADRGGASRAPADDATPDAPATRNTPWVPRVLPPDVAVEDVRDAYAHADMVELRRAYGRINRLGRSNAVFAKAIARLALHDTDRRVAALIRQALETPWGDLSAEQRQTLSTK